VPWYGLHKNNLLRNRGLLNLQNNLNKKTKQRLYNHSLRKQLNKKYLVLSLPERWNFLLFENMTQGKQLFLYSPLYYFTVPIPSKKWLIGFDKNTLTITISSLYFTNFTLTYWTNLHYLFYMFHRPFFLKIKFKGKGYYIYKNKRNTITPQFGYAHRIYKYTFNTSVKFRTKTSIILFGLVKRDVLESGFLIKNMRPINIFTGRGVRFSRQVIYKKTGKVSSYR
jgi:hypothetical protein